MSKFFVRLSAVVLSAVLFVTLAGSSSFAALITPGDSPGEIPSYSGSSSGSGNLLFGQIHSYKVVFRGNGEAVVLARLVIKNPEEAALTKFSFELPNATAEEMSIYQEKLSKYCVEYDYSSSPKICLQWKDPDYTSYYGDYYSQKAVYKEVDYSNSGDLYSMDLPYETDSGKSTALIISYSTKDYVDEKIFGLFSFNFETLKVDSRISEIRVIADVDSDLYMKGKRSQVQYAGDEYAGEIASATSGEADLSKVVSKINSYGPVTKTAKELSPNESFIVKGEYAKSKIRLYLSSIVWGLFIAAFLFLVAYLLPKFIQKRQSQAALSQQVYEDSPRVFTFSGFAIGFFSAVLVALMSYLTVFLLDNYNPRDELVAIGLVILIILVYLFIVFGPAIISSVKHGGWKKFISVFVSEIIWLGLFLLLYIVATAN